jgi:hypothetical protein
MDLTNLDWIPAEDDGDPRVKVSFAFDQFGAQFKRELDFTVSDAPEPNYFIHRSTGEWEVCDKTGCPLWIGDYF